MSDIELIVIIGVRGSDEEGNQRGQYDLRRGAIIKEATINVTRVCRLSEESFQEQSAAS